MDVNKNQQTLVQLSKAVENYLVSSGTIGKIRFMALQLNDFSICFSVDVECDEVLSVFYVKIPKHDLLFKETKSIFPITEEDKHFAEAEYQSLLRLSNSWQGNELGVHFITPVTFLPEFNAIITERVQGRDFFVKLRKTDLRRKLTFCNGDDGINKHFFDLGLSLAKFHSLSPSDASFDPAEVVKKIEKYKSKLISLGAHGSSLRSSIQKTSEVDNFRFSSRKSFTLKGLDIRNILVNDQQELYLLDPGKTKIDFIESDLARFLVTCRIIYWGSLLFFLPIAPCNSYGESFLRGYVSTGQKYVRLILQMLIVKELFKHWFMACRSLELKPWPRILKLFLRHTYIDLFYNRQIDSEFRTLAYLWTTSKTQD